MEAQLQLKEEVRYFCFSTGVDMRKGFHSLFMGKSFKSVKILVWQTNGFVLYHKRLELGRFCLPHKSSNSLCRPEKPLQV